MATSVKLPQNSLNPPRTIGALRLAAVLAAMLLAAILFQILGNAYGSEFGGYPDESAHFITGLMIRDYVASGFHQGPMRYAENYYLHYPKVAFGMWGPLLHFTEAGWMLVFPPSRIAALLLMALITALTALFLYRALWNEVGTPLALLAATMFIAIPNVQTYTAMIMADGMVALMDFLAAMAFARYLDTANWKYSAQFGVFATLSILTKGNGVALVFLPLFAMIFARKLGLLKRGSLWVSAIPLILVALPWQIFSARMLAGIADRQPGWFYLPALTASVVTVLGIALIPLIALGIYDKLITNRRTASGKWSAAAALICAFWLFHWVIPSVGPEPRYLIAITPPMMMFLMAGVQRLAALIPKPVEYSRRLLAVAAAMVILFAATGFSIPRQQHHGFDEIAQLVETPEYKHGAILVASEGDGEGMMIDEVAMREARPSHFVLRASKMFGQGDWLGNHYILTYHTPEEVMKFLDSIPVELVVIDNERGLAGPPSYYALLKQAIAAYPALWEIAGTYPEAPGTGPTIDVYRLKSAAGRNPGKIRIEMPYTLGRSIEH
jgi:Dolichyl-phosphate-mannose-protein mannosyltransferase